MNSLISTHSSVAGKLDSIYDLYVILINSCHSMNNFCRPGTVQNALYTYLPTLLRRYYLHFIHAETEACTVYIHNIHSWGESSPHTHTAWYHVTQLVNDKSDNATQVRSQEFSIPYGYSCSYLPTRADLIQLSIHGEIFKVIGKISSYFPLSAYHGASNLHEDELLWLTTDPGSTNASVPVSG